VDSDVGRHALAGGSEALIRNAKLGVDLTADMDKVASAFFFFILLLRRRLRVTDRGLAWAWPGEDYCLALPSPGQVS